MAATDDPFDALLSLEDDFYKEGYDLGVSDGDRAGLVEGRWFGLEKGFEKYAAMGTLYGRATIWAGRIPDVDSKSTGLGKEATKASPRRESEELSVQAKDIAIAQPGEERVPRLQSSTRLEGHVRTLYALVEAGSLSIVNSEESVSDFDDRLKRAEGKIKIIERLTGESNPEQMADQSLNVEKGILLPNVKIKNGDGSIEDLSSLHARH